MKGMQSMTGVAFPLTLRTAHNHFPSGQRKQSANSRIRTSVALYRMHACIVWKLSICLKYASIAIAHLDHQGQRDIDILKNVRTYYSHCMMLCYVDRLHVIV